MVWWLALWLRSGWGSQLKTLIVGATAFAALQLGACATVTRGSSTAWEVNSVPSGAAVKTSNGMFCNSTPCSLKVKRRSDFTATLTKDGYKSAEVQVTHKIGTGGGVGMAGNVLLGGIIGAAIDGGSGAMFDLTPNPVMITLEREAPGPQAAQ